LVSSRVRARRRHGVERRRLGGDDIEPKSPSVALAM